MLSLICATLALYEVTSYFPDLPRAVVYEVNLRAMGPQPAFRALVSRLDKIHALGVNVLWLMPVQPVGKLKSAGGLGSPYAIQDFTRVNPEFGDEADLRQVVKVAHQLNMAVILDWVADHTSWDHPWVKGHPDWYLHDSQGQIQSPPDEHWPDVAALDYSKSAMRQEMITEMNDWVAHYGVDGFRCDSADRMPFDFWKSAIDSLRAKSPKRLFMLAEGERPDDYAAGFDLTYGWNFSSYIRAVFQGKSATELKAAAAAQSQGLSSSQRRLNFITNHDYAAWEGSLQEFYKSAEGAHGAFVIATLYGGNPLIYSGQEVDYMKRIPIFSDTSIDWSEHPETPKWVSQLIALRRDHIALQTGNVTDQSSADVVLFLRKGGSEEFLVAVNVRDQARSVLIPSEWTGIWMDASSNKEGSISSQMTLPGFGFRVLFRAH